MPSKQDIAIAKGLAKEAGKMVAEELAKMLIPGIGWFTGMVSVVKLIKAMNDPGDESRPVELALRVPQDARFAIANYGSFGQYTLLDFYGIGKGQTIRSITQRNSKLPNTNPYTANLYVGNGFKMREDTYAGEITQKGRFRPEYTRGLRVGFWKSRWRDQEVISTGPDVLVAQAIKAQPKLKQYETELLAGATITIAALKVSLKAELFDADMRPNFSENNPAPLIEYGEALVEYAELVKSLGTYPAGVSTFGDSISYTVLLGEMASKIAEAFGLELGTNFVTFKTKTKTEKDSILGIYRAHLNNEIRNVPGTTTNVVVSMPGSPLESPAATPPPATLPEATYKTTMPIAGVTRGPSVIAIGEDGRVVTSKDLRPIQNTLAPSRGPSVISIGEDGRVVTSKDLRPIQNTLAPSKAEQQLGKLGLVENVSTASEPGTKPAGATDRSVLVLLAAVAAAVALS